MKKFSIFLLLMVFFAPLAMNAQNTITLNGNLTETIAPNTSYTFYDSGGPSAEYSTSETYTATFNSTGNITINFSQFATESSSGCYNWDYMLIYDGSASTGTLICRGQNGCASAALTTNTDYTATSGVMTVVWHSDGSTTAAGWTATITGPVVTTPYIALNPISATVLTGSTKTLTATYGNVSGTPTITYTSSNNSVATVSGSGTSATVTAVAPGTATITATMNGSYTATCDITVEDPHACTPVLTGTISSYYISNFTTTGATNNINNTTSGTGASYSDYYNSYSASAYEGQTINFTITIAGGSTHGSAIWVDWNDDLEFSDNEIVHQTSSYAATPHNGSFTVPTGATLGDHRMRIVTDYSNQQPSNPCSANTGEFEDYKLTVISQPSCMAPTDLALTTDGATVSATWTGTANTYNVEINGTPSPNNPITGTSHTFNVDLSTTYTVRVQANCDGGEISTWSDPVSITTPNCIGAHTINYTLNDSYGDGWNGASITVVEGCEQSSLTVSEGYSASGTLIICGNYFAFIWNTGDFDSECSFTFTEGGTTLFTEPSSVSDGLVLYSFGTATPTPTDLTAGTANTNSVELSWTENGNATAWEICVNDDETNLIPANTNNSFILSGLNTDTEYTVKVRSTNGTIESCWSDAITVHTAEACFAPTDLTATNITTTSATLSWSGLQESYNVRYREVIPSAVVNVTYDFEDKTMQGWTTYDEDEDDYSWGRMYSTDLAHGSEWCVFAWANSNAVPSNWLISPEITLGGTLSFYAKRNTESTGEKFQVYVSTTGTEISDFTAISNVIDAPTAYADEPYEYDLSSYSGNGYVAIRHTADASQWFLYVDDITITHTTPIEYGSWNETNTNVTSPLTINSLEMNTTYEWQLQGVNCDGEGTATEWSETATFTTLTEKHFVTEGDWNVASNWEPAGLPEEGDDVFIDAPAIIPANYLANVGHVTLGANGAITIADGGQLKHSNQVPGTIQKFIAGYGDSSNPGNYYLLGAPLVVDSTLAINSGMVDFVDGHADFDTHGIDLYEFSSNRELEWYNLRNRFGIIGITLNEAYLYARTDDAMLNFSTQEGNLFEPTSEDVLVGLMRPVYTEPEFIGWYLIKNPYSCNAYLASGRDFYRMNATGDAIVLATDENGGQAIKPCEGFFVVIGEHDIEEQYQHPTTLTTIGAQVRITSTEPQSNGAKGMMDIKVKQQGQLADVVRVRFGEGDRTNKLVLNESATRLSIKQDGKDYSVVHSEAQGEMPINFKATQDGIYTIPANPENVEVDYLHLIDNKTGADVDLLALRQTQGPAEYTFEAKTTDYESRFKLVFDPSICGDANGDNGNFAFISSGEIIIIGKGTLQVIDMTGRIVLSGNAIYRVSTNGMPAGVYVLRLISGKRIKTQKIVLP